MTRPTLLQLLAHPATLTGADVHELEQLALAFPYCQTAHLLLAKAAHDQGSMLAGQRLRRAATYAADRARLRQLIEASPTLPAEPALAEVADSEAVAIESAAPAALAVATPLPPASAAGVAAPAAAPLELEPEAEPAELPQPEFPASEELPKAELPAQAPPIRPPAKAAARLEFGLAETEPAEIMAYCLPELEAEPAATPAATAALPPFNGVADVGYAPGEGSRLGFCLQGLEVAAPSAAGLLPSAALPPTSDFFAPDALMLAHLADHQDVAVAAPAPAAQDLINSFLRRAPQGAARRRALLPAPDADDAEQPDLSGRSTRAVPDLASENLAQILARQGKMDRAIAIYERLMVKQPEKMAYFAAQIDSLRPSA